VTLDQWYTDGDMVYIVDGEGAEVEILPAECCDACIGIIDPEPCTRYNWEPTDAGVGWCSVATTPPTPLETATGSLSGTGAPPSALDVAAPHASTPR
jgi:hypothetical protein